MVICVLRGKKTRFFWGTSVFSLQNGLLIANINLLVLIDIICGKDEDAISRSDNGDAFLCFYDVLADYFVRMPESGKPILDLIVQLWSQSFASHIFALLFHKWVCK